MVDPEIVAAEVVVVVYSVSEDGGLAVERLRKSLEGRMTDPSCKATSGRIHSARWVAVCKTGD